MTFLLIQQYFSFGLYTEDDLSVLVAANFLTEEQKEIILNGHE